MNAMTTTTKTTAFQSINPFDNKLIDSFDEINNRELETRTAVAHACYATWKQKSFDERAVVVRQVAQLMRDRSVELARLVTLEMGKLYAEAQGEVELSADIIEYYAENAEEFLAPQRLHPKSGGHAEIVSSPTGVLLGIQPWNFPYYQLARFAAPNIMAGNVVMVKHASNVPQCAMAFEKLWTDAGAPIGTYTNLFISHDQVKHVIDDPRIMGVALTGSVEAGKSVASQAGKNLKKTTMELGGSDAFIVLDDADIDRTVQWALWGKMNNTGQCCVAAKRIIVMDEIADVFLQKFQVALEGLKPGDPMDRHTTLGPLSTEAALIHLLSQVDAAVANGANIIMGGKRINRPGAFMSPTIITDIKPTNPAFREEFFGPVALFFRVKSEAEAIDLANDSDFGLGGCVFTNDDSRGKRVANAVETGMMFINHPTWTAADLPFGGIKNSGYGRELSSLGIQEFVNKKLIRVANIKAPA